MENVSAINKKKIKIMRFVLFSGIVLLILKFTAYFFTHSNAILTDALESIVNVLAGSFALYSIHYASRPKDENHPYGHGKIEFLSSGVEGGMILLAGIGMLFKGGVAFFHKDVIEHADAGAYISGFAGLVNYLLGAYIIKIGKQSHSSVMIADGKHLISDTISSIGLVAGLLIIYFTGLNWIDYVITIIFGAYIVFIGFKLIKESITNLLDEADYDKLQHLIDLLNKNRREKWIDIHNLRILKYGAHLHIDCHITLPWYDTLEESHHEIDQVEKLVKENLDHEIEFFIHADPCLPTSCSICPIKDCKHRKSDFVKQLAWTLDNVLPDKKHQLH